jgi:lysozyme family protein
VATPTPPRPAPEPEPVDDWTNQPAWQYAVLDRLPPGIDHAQLDASLRMTPTERIDELQRLVDLAAELERARGR